MFVLLKSRLKKYNNSKRKINPQKERRLAMKSEIMKVYNAYTEALFYESI